MKKKRILCPNYILIHQGSDFLKEEGGGGSAGHKPHVTVAVSDCKPEKAELINNFIYNIHCEGAKYESEALTPEQVPVLTH